MNDWFGMMLGFLWIFAVIGVSTVAQKKGWFGDETARKFIHIMLGFWIILAYITIENIWIALIAPVVFIVLNTLSYRFNLISAMERDEKSANDLGTVYYVISLAIVTGVTWQLDLQLVGVYAILVLAIGDGLSALVGKRFPAIKLYKEKSLSGFLAVFLSALILGFTLLPEIGLALILLAFIGAFIELVTPKGLDNLTLPLILLALTLGLVI